MRVDVVDNYTHFGIKSFMTREQYEKLQNPGMKFAKLLPDNVRAEIDSQMKTISRRIRYEQGRAWQKASEIIVKG